MKPALRRPARWPLVLAILLSAVAMATLLWLRARFAQEERAQLENAARVFEELVLRPENDSLNFSAIETSVANFRESTGFIGNIFVGKRNAHGEEVLVHPFYHALQNPHWREEIAAWERLRLGPADTPNGWLYVQVVAANRHAVDRTIGLFAAFMVLCLTVLVFRTHGKEIELGRTVSELEERKAEVIRLERLALAGQLSANIFHDIKKPVLNIKHEVCDLLEANQPGNVPRAALQAMRDQTELFFKMLRDLGYEQFVRAEKEASEYCDIAEMIQRSLALVKYEQGDVVVTVEIRQPVPLVFAPPHRLIQLFSNIILNAYQAMKEKGQLAIHAQPEGLGVRIQIKDSGPGIPLELRESVFDPFVTTKATREGSGLGLYICAQIVRDLKGTIRISESTPRGTTFEIEFPGTAQ